VPNAKISELTELIAASFAADDVLPVVDADVSATKKVQAQHLLDALLRVAAAGGVVVLDATAGRLVVRQRGGTAGTHEVQVYHDGTHGYLVPKLGGLRLGTDANDGYLASANGGTAIGLGAGYLVASIGWYTGPYLTVVSGAEIGWSASAGDPTGGNSVGNPSLTRATAGVVAVGTGARGDTLRSVPLTPSQLNADQNNYSPGVARYYRLSTDASRTITGLSVSQVDGLEAEIWNVGSNNLVLAHQSASSTAANRFICTGAADITLAADEITLLRYDATSSRWRVRKV